MLQNFQEKPSEDQIELNSFTMKLLEHKKSIEKRTRDVGLALQQTILSLTENQYNETTLEKNMGGLKDMEQLATNEYKSASEMFETLKMKLEDDTEPDSFHNKIKMSTMAKNFLESLDEELTQRKQRLESVRVQMGGIQFHLGRVKNKIESETEQIKNFRTEISCLNSQVERLARAMMKK